MSRAFVKEQDVEEGLPDRLVSEHSNNVTETWMAQIECTLAEARAAYAAAQALSDRAAIAAASRLAPQCPKTNKASAIDGVLS